ncbi:MAG: hypothetical protein AB8H86_24720 [Polyangiales bacterium]
MKRREFLGVSVGIAGIGLAGCTDFADSADFDAGTPTGSSDSGPGMDAGPGEMDAGPGEMDAGPDETDAGPGEMDAGPGEMDAGPAATCASASLVIGGGHGPDHEDGGEGPSMADVVAAEERTYDIRGVSAHPHTYTLTAANFASLAAGESVMVTSSEDNGHTHSVTIQCV